MRTEYRLAFAAHGAILAAALLGFCMCGAAAAENWPRATYYTVVARPGDTLSKLAARYGVPVAAVERLNRLDQASEIHSGEILRVPAGARSTREAVFSEALDREAHNYAPPPRTASAPAPEHGGAFARDLVPAESASASNSERVVPDAYLHHQSGEHLAFAWPLRGRVISPFGAGGDGERNDGINIAAEQGTPIRAAAAGTVTMPATSSKATAI